MKPKFFKMLLIAIIAMASCIAVDSYAKTGITAQAIEQAKAHPVDIAGSIGIAVVAIGAIHNGSTVDPLAGLWVISKSEYEALLAKHKALYIVDVVFSNTEKYQFISKRPTRTVIEAVVANQNDTFKVADLMIENMIVAGDKSVLDDGVVFNRTIEQLGQIVKDGHGAFTKA